ncbi:fasciclin domain-containing protein [Paracoccaceae bacterium GXU_MW_L88]
MNLIKIGITAAFASTAGFAFADNHESDAAMSEMPATVVDIVVNSEDHETLEAAVIAADLAEALSGEGPFTVFAPTDGAFEALPEGTLEEVLMPENQEQLVQILGCHVVETKAMAEAVVQMVNDDGGAHDVTTMGNCALTLSLDGDMVKINDAVTVTAADLEAGNGVVHVIDGVLLPAM